MGKVLVTGGAGFIGSHVVDALLKQGEEVVVVDDLSRGKAEHVNPKAKLYPLRIEDSALEEVFVREGVEWVNHHAAQIDVRRSVADPLEDARVNVQGLLNLLECARRFGVKGIVFASSGGVVYGEPQELPVPEDHPKAPLSPYGVSKLASEYYLLYYARVHGLPYVALRYGNVYGPRQDPHGEAGVVAIFAQRMLQGETPVIYGDGEQTRDFVYVDDVVRANLAALALLRENPPSPRALDDAAYNVATGEETSVNELFRRLQGLTGFEGTPRYEPERSGELRRIALDPRKARQALGWEPTVALQEGLQRTVGFFRSMAEGL